MPPIFNSYCLKATDNSEATHRPALYLFIYLAFFSGHENFVHANRVFSSRYLQSACEEKSMYTISCDVDTLAFIFPLLSLFKTRCS